MIGLAICLGVLMFNDRSSYTQDEDNKKTINLTQNRRDTGNIGHTQHRRKTIKKTMNLRQNRRDTDNIGHTRQRTCVPNVVSVPSVLSKVYCFFIVFLLCRVCPMLSVSLLFCLRFIVFFYCLSPVLCVLNVAHTTQDEDNEKNNKP
jgi:Flp pilus assembly protein TadB